MRAALKGSELSSVYTRQTLALPSDNNDYVVVFAKADMTLSKEGDTPWRCRRGDLVESVRMLLRDKGQ